MRIFIGCSTSHLCGKKKSLKSIHDDNIIEKRESLGYYLFKKLNEVGHKVEAWWRPETLKHGEDFFKKIHSLSHDCDSGIFILNNENKLNTKKDSYSYISNDNVYVELGMFISNKGLNNIIFIADNDIKLPSDFNSLNVIRYNLNETDLKKREETFNKILGNIKLRLDDVIRYFPTDYINANVFFNYDTSDLILNKNKVTQSWNSKSAYLGIKAAKIWADIELNPDYLPENFKYNFKTFLEKIQYTLKDVRNIISLGSGIGTLDEDVLRVIPFKGPIKYIPIEINPYLAVQSLHRGHRSIINLHSTYAIIDDFEDQTSQLYDFIKYRIVKTEEKSLYTLLGGTFCNLDNQNSFLNNWSQIIDTNDYFLLDVYTKNDRYNLEKDLEFRVKNDFTKPLINNAIEHKYETTELFKNSKKVKEYLNLNWDKRKSYIYNKYVEIKSIETSNDNTLFIYRFKTDKNFRNNNVTTLFKVKRHSKKTIENKIKKYFKILKKQNIILNPEISRTYFLCKLKKTDYEK